MKKPGLILMFLFFSTNIFCQITIQKFGSSLPLFSSANIYDFAIINNTPNILRGNLKISLFSHDNTIVATTNISNIILKAGVNVNWLDQSQIPVIEYSLTSIGQKLANAQIIYQGNFRQCIDFAATNQESTFASDCAEIRIQNFIALNLTLPCNDCQIFTENPMLTWHASIIPDPENHYSIKICKIQPGQSKEESQIFNLPILELDKIPDAKLFYELSFQKLKVGSSYSWQVQLWNGTDLLKTSDTWAFFLGDISSPEKYTDIRIPSPFRNNNPYVYSDGITFMYDNRFNMKSINLKIEDVTNQSRIIYQDKIILTPYENIVQIPFSTIPKIDEKSEYLITFYDIRNQPYYLYFTVKN